MPAAPRSLPIRPQYGSSPNHEHFVSWLRAMARAPMSASASLPAPRTSTRTTLVAPSASPTICAARLKQASARASVNSVPATGPRRPEASTITVSFVDVHPSLTMRLKLASTAARSDSCNMSGSAAASVVRTASIVAMFGASIAAPLAMPPTQKPGRTTRLSLGTVSVVMMARAAAVPPWAERAAWASAAPPSTASMGNGMPIRPVEHTSTCSGGQPRARPAAPAIRSAWTRPVEPLAALALPLLRITALARPPVAARWARLTTTGAAASLFGVKTAAAGTGAPSVVATSARSGSPEALTPAATPAATNPVGAVTLMGRPPRAAGPRSPAGRAGGWRTAPPAPRLPSPGCRAQRGRRPNPCARRTGR